MSESGPDTIPTGEHAADGPRRIGPYEILDELGRGGQGVVYLAKDTRLDRKVALKVLTRLGPGSEHVLARFKREAEVTSRLEHPAICGVIDAAIEGSIPYIAMRYVEGDSLAKLIATSRIDPTTVGDTSIICFDDDDDTVDAGVDDEAPSGRTPTKKEVVRVIKVFESAARGLHAAHEAGVVHRDIKPGNIIIAGSDQPVILDFGMAHDDAGDGPSLTQSGDLFGTPAYMSPEQLMGQRIALDRRTDVWSLGVTLYECLTLQKPFEAPTRQALYQTIMTREPPDPRSANAAIPFDLKVVLDTALEKDRDRRYQSALELAEELRRVRCYEPIQARPAGAMLKLRRWSQRNPAAATLVVALIVLLPALSWFFAKSRGEAERARLEATLRENAEQRAETLAWEKRSEEFLDQTDDLTARMGVIQFVLNTDAAYAKHIVTFMDAFAAFGLPLDGSLSLDELVATFAGVRERDEAIAREVLTALANFEWVFEVSIEDSKDAKHRPLQDALGLSRQLVDRVEWDDWYRRVHAASARYDGQEGHFDAFYREASSGNLGPDKVAWLGNILCFITIATGEEIDPRGLRLLDEGLLRQPDNFEMRFARGGYAMEGYDGSDPNHVSVVTAQAQFQMALAARPDSGIAWSMMGLIHSARRQHRQALVCLDRAVELSPDDALCWLFHGFQVGMAGNYELAERSFKRALELEPIMTVAQEGLDAVRERRRPISVMQQRNR